MTLDSLVAQFFPDLDVRLDHFEIADGCLALTLTTQQRSAPCPLCNTPSSRRHSGYVRTLHDLPWGSLKVRLQLRVRRLCCGVIHCPRRVFAERLPSLSVPYGRITNRLQEVLIDVALRVGGEAGKRLLAGLGISSSGDRLLSLLHDKEVPPTPKASVVGVDDFALKKGRSYGTIIVDQETGRPLEVLSDRTAETLAAWLEAHPELEVVTRDRATEYERGVSLGAPQATQVLDRWHLLKNLREACERQLGCFQKAIDTVASEVGADYLRVPRSTREEAAREEALEKRRGRIQEVRDLRAQGMSISAIAKQVKASRTFVRRSINLDALPQRRPRKQQVSLLDPFKTYLEKRWREGCHNAKQLWREVCERGYPGGYKPVHQWRQRQRLLDAQVAQGDIAAVEASSSSSYRKGFSSRQLVWLLVHEAKRLSTEEQEVFAKLCKQEPLIEQIRNLAQDFRDLFKNKCPEALNAWFQAVAETTLEDLKTFATSLRREQEGLMAAIVLPWSNGRLEGTVTKVKLIKRSMFGRGSFDLLRKRILLAA
jgi:transposase